MKVFEEKERREKREINKTKTLEFLKEGNKSMAREYATKAIDVTPKMAYEVIERLYRK